MWQGVRIYFSSVNFAQLKGYNGFYSMEYVFRVSYRILVVVMFANHP